MRFVKTFLFTALLSSLGLGSPTRQHGGENTHNVIEANDEGEGSDGLYQRDVRAANMVLIKDIVATTGWDMKTKEDLTPERIARLAPADAQRLSGEMNKYLTNHGRQDAVIPAFTQEDFKKAAEEVNKGAHREAEHDGTLAARAEDADYGALVEARGIIWSIIAFIEFAFVIIFW